MEVSGVKRKHSDADVNKQNIITLDNLVLFPIDIWKIIFGFLNNGGLYIAIRTCKDWYNIASVYIDPTIDLRNNVLATYAIHHCLDCLKSIFNNPKVKNNKRVKDIILQCPDAQDSILYHVCDAKGYEWMKFILENSYECTISLDSTAKRALYRKCYDIAMLFLADPRIGSWYVKSCLEFIGLDDPEYTTKILDKYWYRLSGRNKSDVLCTIFDSTEDYIIKRMLEDPHVDPSYNQGILFAILVRKGNLELLDMVLRDQRVIDSPHCKELSRLYCGGDQKVIHRLVNAGIRLTF